MEVFNNLRTILTRRKENMPVVVVAEMLAEIEEAEAKWKADCCEWKAYGGKAFIESPHSRKMYDNSSLAQNVYCNTCGKPIKIVEVE